jgi:hypothetical protein
MNLLHRAVCGSPYWGAMAWTWILSLSPHASRPLHS